MNKLDPLIFKIGSALLICQIFESSLLLLHQLIDESIKSSNSTTKIGDNYSKDTLGNLLNKLKIKIDIPKDTCDFIFEAITIRNSIVHGYLTKKEHMVKFENDGELLSLIADLDIKINQIRERAHLICEFIDKYLEKYGTSTEILKRLAEKNSNIFL